MSEYADAATSPPAADLLHEPAVDSALEVEQHGFDYIAESERYLRPRGLFSFWLGANAYIIYVFIGGLLVSLGLSLAQAAAALVIGFLGFLFIGYLGVGGARSGLPTMTFTRAAFGVRGNRLNALLAWVELIAFEALNAVFGVFALVALAEFLGISASGPVGYVVATFVIVGISAIVAIYGHRLLFVSQKVFATALSAVLVLVALFSIGQVDWSYAGTLEPGAVFGVFLVAIAIAAANPLSFIIVAADYSRYLPSNTPARQITWWTFAGAASITMFLGLLGVVLASRVDLTDPIAGIQPLIPGWLFVPFAIAAAGGSIANNAITFYSSGLTIQAIGIPLQRWRATLLDCILATIIVLYILLLNQDLQTTMANFLAFLNVWVGSFGGVWVADGLLRRWRFDPVDIHRISPVSAYWGNGGVNLAGMGSLAIGIVVGLLTINAPNFQGPISKIVGGGDLAWIAPLLAAAVSYWLLAGRRVRAQAAELEEAR